MIGGGAPAPPSGQGIPSFCEFGEMWLTGAPMADRTRAMRRATFERELKPVWRNRLPTETTPDGLRAHCAKIVERGAPTTAVHARATLACGGLAERLGSPAYSPYGTQMFFTWVAWRR